MCFTDVIKYNKEGYLIGMCPGFAGTAPQAGHGLQVASSLESAGRAKSQGSCPDLASGVSQAINVMANINEGVC